MSEWIEKANCASYDPDIFFPERGGRKTLLLAKAICAQCLVQEECLEYGLMEKDGVYGGTSGKERRIIRRQRKAMDNCNH